MNFLPKTRERKAGTGRWGIWLAFCLAGVAGLEQGLAVQPEYLVDVWQTSEGLPQNSVTAIVQTRDGYLWFGTFNGLIRFDGVKFRVYDESNTPELKSSRIVRLFEDSRGFLWIGMENGGVAKLAGDRFIAFDWESFGNYPVTFMTEDGAGAIWLATGGGRLHRYQGGSWEQMRSGGVSALAAEAGGRLWVGLGGRDLVYYMEGKFSEPERSLGPVDFLGGGFEEGVWVGGGRRLRKLGRSGWVRDLGEYHWPPGTLTAVMEDRHGNVWAGTYGSGLFRYGPDGEMTALNQRKELPHDVIRSLYEDREGNIWVGTDGGGLVRLKERTLQVYDRSRGLSENLILSVCADSEGGIWVGTNGGGVNRVEGDQITRYGAGEGLSSLHVWSVYEDRKKNVWAGTWGGGVLRYVEGRFVPAFPEELIHPVVFAIYEDRRGVLWFGTQGGLTRVEEGTSRTFTTRDGLSHDDIRAVAEDRDGNIWIGTNGGGLNRYRDGEFSVYGRAEGLAHNSVWSLHADGEGGLWVGTFGGGLSRFDGVEFVNFTGKGGLTARAISSIIEDGLGHLWLSSYSGVFRVNMSELNAFARGESGTVYWMHFGKAEGLPSTECPGGFQPAAARGADGRLWFPTVKGLAVLNPAELKLNRHPPRVVLEELAVNGEVWERHGAGRERELPVVIPAGSGQFEFRYTAPSFVVPEKVRFKYKLEGLDQDWVDAGSRRTAYYSHIPPGKYRFNVMAGNNDGVWNEQGPELWLTILPPVWRTPWVVLMLGMLGVSGIAGTVRYLTTKKLQRRLDRLQQQHAVEQERARIARDIHDDLGASLTQITLLSELARSDLGHPEEAEAHIRQISDMARKLTRSMDEIVWAVNPLNDTLEGLTTYICKLSQEYLLVAGIRCRLDVPAQFPHHPLSTEVRHNLFLAFKEALNNVVKHAGASEALIRLKLVPDGLLLEVEDNGNGSRAAVQGNGGGLGGNGLVNMKKRMEDIGGDFELETRPESGLRCRLRVPLRRG